MRTVTLHGSKAAGRVAYVDDSDYALVSAYRWHVWERTDRRLPAGPYAVTSVTLQGRRRVTLSMHALITGWHLTDHENHKGLDCRRSNLREATGMLNAANRQPAPGWSSIYKGVSWAGGKWRAQISTRGQAISLGTYRSEEAAARAYDKAAVRLWGQFACVNLPADPLAPLALALF